MILRWLISFSVAAALASAAEVSGRIALQDSRLDSVNKHKDFSGVVISLKPVGARTDPDRTRHSVMVQKNKTFTPHILPVLMGSVVDFPNYDPIFHNAFSNYSGQTFDVSLYPPGTSKAVRFSRPGVVRVFCNIHPSMSAIIVVLDTPYFTATAADGSFKLDVPPGEYDLAVFHERASDQTLRALARRITVTAEPVRLPAITVSEAGYLPAPHTNKYGKSYPPTAEDGSVYPGVRN